MKTTPDGWPGWVGVDLDGTLAHYESKQFPEIGPPIPLMQQRVLEWLANGVDVRIVTARANPVNYMPGDLSDQLRRIDEWTKKHLGQTLLVTYAKDYQMIELWDDRARRVEVNTGREFNQIATWAKEQRCSRCITEDYDGDEFCTSCGIQR